MTIENANSHPIQVEVVNANSDTFYANSHPYKIAVVGGHIGIEARIVDELPEVGETGYIYLVLKETTKEGDIYDEYMWVLQQDGETYDWEHIGSTSEVTLKLYDTTGQNTDGAMTQKAVTDELAAKQNTLTAGEAINITNGVISATNTGKAKVLTTADYNYPTNNPNSVALWLLDDGIYIKSTSINVRKGASDTIPTSDSYIFFVNSLESAGYKQITMFGSGGTRLSSGWQALEQIRVTGSGIIVGTYNAVLQNQVKHNLTSTDTYDVLGADQGKVLKDMIDSLIIKGSGAPTTSTVGTVGQLYEDTTNGKLYQCTAVSGSTYTWGELATKSYVDMQVGSIETLMTALISGGGAQ